MISPAAFDEALAFLAEAFGWKLEPRPVAVLKAVLDARMDDTDWRYCCQQVYAGPNEYYGRLPTPHAWLRHLPDKRVPAVLETQRLLESGARSSAEHVRYYAALAKAALHALPLEPELRELAERELAELNAGASCAAGYRDTLWRLLAREQPERAAGAMPGRSEAAA